MTVEAIPVGQACNLACTYCYENGMREAGNIGGLYDVDAMIVALERENQKFTLFGGEPLLMKIEDMTRLLEYGFKKYGGNGIQTNGTLIRDDHVELFRRTNTTVGMSIDGPADLNTPRLDHSGNNTADASMEGLKKCRAAGLPVGLIITIHRHNASVEAFPRFLAWLKELDALGIESARLHLLEGHHCRGDEMTPERTTEVYLELAKFEMRELKKLRFDKFQEMLALLANTGEQVSCVWKDCDPYTTDAVRGVNGDGTSSNCGRANKDGVNWLKGESVSHIRQIALYNTAYEDGGCRDCRFFLVCRGYCPGTAEDTDWRNRTEHCRTLITLYTHFEQVLLDSRRQPLSLHPDRAKLEAQLLARLEKRVTYSQNQQHIDWHLNNGIFTGTAPVK